MGSESIWQNKPKGRPLAGNPKHESLNQGAIGVYMARKWDAGGVGKCSFGTDFCIFFLQ